MLDEVLEVEVDSEVLVLEVEVDTEVEVELVEMEEEVDEVEVVSPLLGIYSTNAHRVVTSTEAAPVSTLCLTPIWVVSKLLCVQAPASGSVYSV